MIEATIICDRCKYSVKNIRCYDFENVKDTACGQELFREIPMKYLDVEQKEFESRSFFWKEGQKSYKIILCSDCFMGLKAVILSGKEVANQMIKDFMDKKEIEK